jgi:acyl-CoA thioester hydrolase
VVSELGAEVWRGSVNTWECDQTGHMNVRFYLARAVEGLASLAARLGLPGGFRPNADATLIAGDHHMRFLKEARAGEALSMRAGVISIDKCSAWILQLLLHADGQPAAAIQTRVIHATSREERPFPWSAMTLERAAHLRVEVPERLAPRSLSLDPPSGDANLEAAERSGMTQLALGAFGAEDCDVFGRVLPWKVLGRISDGVPTLLSAGQPRDPNIGGAVLEFRLAYQAWPKAGDRFDLRSGIAGFDDRIRRVVHWVIDPDTGQPWATGEAVAVALDLTARKIAVPTEASQVALSARVIKGLRF